MLEIIVHHRFWVAVASYWVLSAAVSALPEPAGNGRPVYLWLYRFSHTVAGNLTTAFFRAERDRACASPGSRIPDLRILGLLVVVPLLTVSATSCAAHYTVHPGALNATDSAAYDTLLIAETTIEQARLDLKAGQLPDGSKAALDALIQSYNVARTSWLTYRGAVTNNTASPADFDQLTKDISDLTDAIRKFTEVTP